MTAITTVTIHARLALRIAADLEACAQVLLFSNTNCDGQWEGGYRQDKITHDRYVRQANALRKAVTKQGDA